MTELLLEEFKKCSLGVVSSLKKEIGGVRTNRPNPALIENIKVGCYGELLALKQVGSIMVQPPREINVQVWDKSVVSGAAKAIEAANLGFSVSISGNVVKIFLPELSAERREELIKHVKHLTEEHRIRLRHFRDETNKKIQKAFDENKIDEDQKFRLKGETQKETDKANKDVSDILESKIKEIEI